ncbi:MAG: hypothetical protein E6J94_01750 [Methanobacteriota archaeon]|nr:MAG: hypothetical protein E6J94_01750 [Euryarchaeota archaeon]
MGSGNKGLGVSGRAHYQGRQPGGNLLYDTVGIAAVRRIFRRQERFRPMPARDRRASTIDLTADLSDLSPQGAREFLAAALEANANRPEAIVNIQRQLELTIGGSSKGILYLSGERSAQEGMNPLESVLSTRAPLTLANARRLMDVSALLGWGRLEMSLFDPEHGRLVLTVSNSPLARAYGSSKKPVCHFLTGWIAGLGRNLLEREVLCEETACAAQGHGRCEFELRPLSPL